MGSDKTTLLIGGTAFGGAIIIILIILLAYFFTRPKPVKKEPEPELKVTPKPPEPTPAARKDETPVEKCPSIKPPEESPRGNCPSAPYNYCSMDNIEKVYIVSGCTPSANLIRKLTTEGKITGEDDPKVVKCCKNPDVCAAAGIKSYPSVICSNAPTTVYQGYCD